MSSYYIACPIFVPINNDYFFLFEQNLTKTIVSYWKFEEGWGPTPYDIADCTIFNSRIVIR